MRVKHFAGYGSVEAKKIEKRTDENGDTILTIQVMGDHERGLVPHTLNDAVRWLLPRFDKSAKDISPWDVGVVHQWLWGLPMDAIRYSFIYKARG